MRASKWMFVCMLAILVAFGSPAHVLIGGHIVLLNRKTNLMVDVFAF
jgi:hypothetical protein